MSLRSRILEKICSGALISLTVVGATTLNMVAQNVDAVPGTAPRPSQVLELSLTKRLNSGRAKVGDDVALKLAKPLVVDGATVLPANWIVHGRVMEVNRAAKHCKPGSVRWELQSITLQDGSTVAIRAISEDVARGKLLDQAPRDTGLDSAATISGKKARTTGATIGHIAEGMVVVPLLIGITAIAVLAEMRGTGGNEFCPQGKGLEDSIRAGTIFYAEISGNAQ